MVASAGTRWASAPPIRLRSLLISVALIAVALVLLVAAPAAAHTAFDSSDPADNSTVVGPVDEVQLRFDGPVVPTGEGFLVRVSNGDLRTPDRVDEQDGGENWLLGFDPPLEPGLVGVRWTVQAPDAHPIQGGFRFTVLDTPTQEEGSTPAPAPDSGSNPLDEATSESERSQSESPTVAADDDQPRVGSIDDFLIAPAQVASGADAVGAVGRAVGLTGTALAIGGLIFLSRVVTDRLRDEQVVLGGITWGGALIVLGGVVELVAYLAGNEERWAELLTRDALETQVVMPFGLAVGLRMLCGFVLVVSSRTRMLALATVTGALGVVASYTFDGHTVTTQPMWLVVPADVVHVVTGSAWAGGVMMLAIVLWRRRRSGQPVDARLLVTRFSTVASLSAVAAGLSGVAMTSVIVDDLKTLFDSTWGRALLVKVGLVIVAGLLGAFNHFRLRPQTHRLLRTVRIEALAFLAVLTATAILVAQGTARL